MGEAIVVVKQPLNKGFEGATAVEAGGARVGDGEAFGFGDGAVEFGPFGAEEVELGGGLRGGLGGGLGGSHGGCLTEEDAASGLLFPE